MSKVTLEEKGLLAAALVRAKTARDRDGGVAVFKVANKYHGGYVDFPAGQTLAPLDGAEDVAVDAAVSILFDKDVTEVDFAGITIDAETEVTGILPSLAGRTLTVAHDAFANDELHTLTIPADAVRNAHGLGNRQIVWSFTTVGL